MIQDDSIVVENSLYLSEKNACVPKAQSRESSGQHNHQAYDDQTVYIKPERINEE